MTQPDRLALTSLDIVEDRKAQLRQTFPDVFREDKIDFDALKRALGEWVTPDKERFGLNWPGKAECSKLIQQASVGTLLPMREQSVDFDSTENLIIEGDNLEVLKLLQKSYYGKVKMIYIDPPYNTGNEFIYPDNFHEGLQDYLKYSEQVDAEGRKQSTNTESGGRYHSNWLSMMYPRLFLARNLLREDGVIFVSIDDHEVHNLRALMNEIFGEENFIASIVWQKRTSPDARLNLGAAHDYLLVYKLHHDIEDVISLLPISEQRKQDFTNTDNDENGAWASVDLTGQVGHATPSQFYEITTPAGVKYSPPDGRCWAISQSTYLELENKGRIWFGKNNDSRPRLKRYLSEVTGVTSWTWWANQEVGHNQEAKKEINEIFEKSNVFDTPKPTRLLKRVLQLATKTNQSDIILDFFAGSGTAAHAIMELNKEDNGNRKFILVQLPEPTDNPDYPTIADITRERVRRVSAKLKAEQAANLPDLLTTSDDSKSKTTPDFGFKAFRLATSNFKVWDGAAEQMTDVNKTLELFADHVLDGRSAEDMLYELLLKTGFALTTPVTSLTLADKQVFSAADGALLICLERELSIEVIEAMVALDPFMILCLDAGFAGKDELKVNAMQTVRAHNRNRHSSISLKVV